jgi:hypothetical protein
MRKSDHIIRLDLEVGGCGESACDERWWLEQTEADASTKEAIMPVARKKATRSTAKKGKTASKAKKKAPAKKKTTAAKKKK